MTENDDNIIAFKPKSEPELDEKKQLQKELLDRIFAGSQNLRNAMRNEHILYYLTIFFVFVAVVSWVFIAISQQIVGM